MRLRPGSNARKTRSENICRVGGANSLYDAAAAWMGEPMAEPAQAVASGTEISARSKELVLPIDPVPESTRPIYDPGRETGLSDTEAPRSGTSQTASLSGAAPETIVEETLQPTPLATSQPTSQPASQPASQPTREAATTPVLERGLALTGDRGPRIRSSQSQRPSFWRRIALGGRRANRAEVVAPDSAPTDPSVDTGALTSANPSVDTGAVTSANPSVDTGAIEQRIVEPMLQALVSVEAKLERSHIDLTKRSDQVEQRLTQLWDIEEQLAALPELQESLLRVSEQQRRLESVVDRQTRTLRWLVGAIFFSLAATVFVVAAMIR